MSVQPDVSLLSPDQLGTFQLGMGLQEQMTAVVEEGSGLCEVGMQVVEGAAEAVSGTVAETTAAILEELSGTVVSEIVSGLGSLLIS